MTIIRIADINNLNWWYQSFKILISIIAYNRLIVYINNYIC